MRAVTVKGRIHPFDMFTSGLIFLHNSPRGSVTSVSICRMRTPSLTGGDVIFPGSQLPRDKAGV